MDAPRAALGNFGGRVAHGSLLISVAIGLGSSDVPQTNMVAMVGSTWRFLKAVKPGMTVHASWRLGRKREVSNPRWGLVVWQVELDDQNQERVLEGEVTCLVNRRDVALPAASRSRRRRRGKAPPEVPVITAESNLPEPAPADAPSPARRQRRPATPTSVVREVPTAAPDQQPAAPDQQAEAAAPATEPAAPPRSSRRRRRRRGGGGGGGAAQSAANGGGSSATLPAAEPALSLAPAPAPPPAADPPRSEWAAPEPAKPAQRNDGNPVSRVLGRLRRPRPKPQSVRDPPDGL